MDMMPFDYVHFQKFHQSNFTIGLVTKLISDLCYVWVDPRVKFD